VNAFSVGLARNVINTNVLARMVEHVVLIDPFVMKITALWEYAPISRTHAIVSSAGMDCNVINTDVLVKMVDFVELRDVFVSQDSSESFAKILHLFNFTTRLIAASNTQHVYIMEL